MTIAAVAPTVATREVTAYTRSGSTQVRGQLTEKTTQQAFEMFGLELNFPAVWLCNLADATSLKVGDRGTVNSRAYIVRAGPQQMGAEPITAHARYLVERDS